MRALAILTAVTSALLAGALPAAAADMATYKAPPPAPSADNWTGFYVGIHGGGAWGNLNATVVDFSNTGFIWGAQAGHNWKYGNFVVGLEADVSMPVHKDTKTIGDTSISAQMDYLASVRARVGYLLTPDLLVFGTGGAGFGHGQITAEDMLKLSAVHFGPVAGGGLEYALTRNLSARVEGMHYWLGGASYLVLPATVNPTVVRGALNLRF